MSTFERVKSAKNAQDGLAAVAHGIDHICTRLDAIDKKLNKGSDEAWGKWETDDEDEPDQEENDAAIQESARELKAAAFQKIRAIETKLADNPDGDERRQLEAALRLAKDDLRDLGSIEAGPPPSASVVEVVDGEVVVNLPKPGPERQEKRAVFAKAMQLDDSLGAGMAEHYVKGGPLWLYYGNRDFVVELPPAAKMAMVTDVMEDDPIEAQQMSADLLKYDDVEGPETVLDRVHGTD